MKIPKWLGFPLWKLGLANRISDNLAKPYVCLYPEGGLHNPMYEVNDIWHYELK